MAGFFGLFDFEKPGKGVEKEQREKRSFFQFWEIVWQRLWSLTKINLMYFMCIFPLIFYIYMVYMQSTGQYDISLFAILVNSVAALVPYWIFYVFLFASIIIYGPATAAMTYILRNYARREHSWIAFDFYDQMRKNFKQALAAGLIDITVAYLLFTYFANASIIPSSWFYRTIIYLAVFIFIIMRFYIYTMIVTFNLNIFQMYKNAWMFVILGMKRNIVIILSLVLTALVFFALPGVGMLLDVVYFAFFGLAFSGFIITFTVYPVLKKYMIDPYYEQNPPEKEESVLSQGASSPDKPSNEEADKGRREDPGDEKWLM